MPTNPKEYTNLRTLLDSLEVGALRYYLNGTGLSQPQKFKYLQDLIKPIADELWELQQAIDCPPGYYDCEGCCVPYKCPEIFDTNPKKAVKATKRKR